MDENKSILFNVDLSATEAKAYKKELNVLDPSIANTPDVMLPEERLEVQYTFLLEYCDKILPILQAMHTLVDSGNVTVDFDALHEGELALYHVLKELYDMRRKFEKGGAIGH